MGGARPSASGATRLCIFESTVEQRTTRCIIVIDSVRRFTRRHLRPPRFLRVYRRHVRLRRPRERECRREKCDEGGAPGEDDAHIVLVLVRLYKWCPESNPKKTMCFSYVGFRV